jgi:hypothetical protein
MRKSGLFRLSFLILIASSFCFADYAWIPVKRKLVLRTGMDWNKSFENFDTDGFLVDLALNSQPIEVRDFSFYAFGEYGIGDQWSTWMRLQFVDAVAAVPNTGALVAGGSGLGDTWIGLKRALTTTYPLATVETYLKLPFGSSSTSTADTLVTGEGNLDIGLRMHLGLRDGDVLFAFSPGLLLRFGGYATAGTLEAALQYNFPYHAYGRVFAEGMLPFSEEALAPSTLTNHNILGTAGSYMKLAASPAFLSAGVRAGINFTPSLGIESYAALAFQGRRAPRNLRFGFNMLFNFDFYQPDYRPKVKEVPFDSNTQVD